MADKQVNRDVVLTLKLKRDAAASKGAAQSVKSDLKDIATAHMEAEKQIREASAKTSSERATMSNRSASQSVAVAETTGKKTAQAAENAGQKVQDVDKRVFSNRMKLLSRIQQEEELARKKQSAAAEKAAAEAQGLRQQGLAAEKASAEAFKTTLGGMMQFAQGAAQIGVLQEESLEKVLRGLAKVQAVFNVLSGGITVWYGISDAIKAATEATNLKAAANMALAKSQGAIAKGATSAAGSAVGSAATTAGGAAAGGAAANAGAGGLLAMAKGAAVLGAQLTVAAAAGGALGEAITRLVTGGRTGTITEFIGWMKDVSKNAKQQAEIQEKEIARQQRLQEAAARDSKIANQARFDASVRQQNDSLAARRDAVTTTNPRAQAESARERARREVEAAQQEMEDMLARAQSRRENMEVASEADRLQAVERLKNAREQQVSAEERILDTIRSQVSERKSAVEAAENEVARARELVKQEEERERSSLARFGRLGKGEQARLEKISEKRKSGEELGRADIDFLEQTGFGSKITQDFYADKGNAANGKDVLAGLGESDALIQARKDEMKAVMEQRDATRELISLKNEEANATRQLIANMNRLQGDTNQQNQSIAQAEGVQFDSQDAAGIQSDLGATVAALREGVKNVKESAQEMATQMNANRGVI